MDAIETYVNGGRELRIYYDEHAESPRMWDNLGTMVCFHDRYDLGDKHGFENADEVVEYLEETGALFLPLFLYEHGGITMKTSGFNDPWDSGQVGVIYVEKEKVRQEYNIKNITKKCRDIVRGRLMGEVEEYDRYIRGDVYGFVDVEVKECECCGAKSEITVDSCSGFYGWGMEENGMIDMIDETWREIVLA
jgi:hypothetical protein